MLSNLECVYLANILFLILFMALLCVYIYQESKLPNKAIIRNL